MHKNLFTLFNSDGPVKDTIPHHSSYFSQYRYKENSVQEVRATLPCNYKQVLRRLQCLKVVNMQEQCVTPGVKEPGELPSEKTPRQEKPEMSSPSRVRQKLLKLLGDEVFLTETGQSFCANGLCLTTKCRSREPQSDFLIMHF